jgi:hypothetical protein
MCVGLTTKAFELFRHPFPFWMGDAPQWYDQVLAAAMYLTVAGACLVYLHRTREQSPKTIPARSRPRPTRWRERIELRVVLYCLATLLAIQLPLEIMQAVRAVDYARASLPYRVGFWDAFSMSSCFGPLVALAMIFYDRRRIRRERKDSGKCLNCGYELRASPDRCPECGTPVPHGRSSGV